MNLMDTSQRAPTLGTGIYTVAEAARLLQVSTRKVQGWADGYVHHRNGEVRVSSAVLDGDEREPGLLTFHDLVELYFVREFRNAGVSLPHIRDAAQVLREEWKTPYPFAQTKIVSATGGKLVEREELRTVLGKQQVFEFAREFFKDVDFDRDGLAAAWHPLGKNHLVVLDPHRAFGAPIDVRSGVRTDVLYRMYLAEDREAEVVAQWYEVALEAVQDAVKFEETWQKAA